jgi:hypothetical protein
MKFITIAPNRISVQVATSGYHSASFKHGSIITDENLARMFPNIFVYIPDAAVISETRTAPVLEIPKVEVETPAEPVFPTEEETSDLNPEKIQAEVEAAIENDEDSHVASIINFSKSVNQPHKTPKKGKK